MKNKIIFPLLPGDEELDQHLHNSSHNEIDIRERGIFDIFPDHERNRENGTNIRHEHQCFLKENDRW